jgi:hypothetical protein
MKAYGERRLAPPFLTTAPDESEWSAIPQYPLDRRLNGIQSRCGRCGEERNFLSVPSIKLRPCSAWLVAIPTELSRLPLHRPRFEGLRTTGGEKLRANLISV